MPRPRKQIANLVTQKAKPRVKKSRQEIPAAKNENYFSRFRADLAQNQTYLNIILGLLILLVLGALLFNYFTNRNNSTIDQNLGPAQQTVADNLSSQSPQQSVKPTANLTETTDVSKEKLPGKYTIKSGDTLFKIAQKYYDNGYKYPEIAKANNLSNPNLLATGQVIEIPKSEVLGASTAPSPTPQASVIAKASPVPNTNTVNLGKGGSETATIWGEKITGDTYTVQKGDWLSKIAGRAYGDIMQYKMLAQVNNISNPNHILPGTVIKIPR